MPEVTFVSVETGQLIRRTAVPSVPRTSDAISFWDILGRSFAVAGVHRHIQQDGRESVVVYLTEAARPLTNP